MRHRRHESALFWLSLAGVIGLMGFGLITFEATRFGEKADPWHHFWFVLGIAGIGLSVAFAAWACWLFGHQRWIERRSDESDQPREVTEGTALVEEVIRRFDRRGD
jgi:hypothetical protein